MDNTNNTTAQEISHRRLTARNLRDFQLCPQKYLLSLFVSPAESRKFIGGPAALHQGIRQALVECYHHGGPQETSLQNLLELFEANWEGQLCADSLEEAQRHKQGVAMLTDYYHTHQDQPNWTIAVSLRLTDEIQGHSFVVVADRVDRSESGLITLLRYKTGRSTPGPGGLAKDLSAGLLLLLGTKHYASASCQTAIYALQPGRLIVADTDQAQRERLREQIAEIAGEIRSTEDFPTHKGQHCRWCRSRTKCPAWAQAHYQREEHQ